MATTRQNLLLDAINNDGFNSVSAHQLPDGGIAIMISHRITLDSAVVVRVRDDSDVAFMQGSDEEQATCERINERGPWDLSSGSS